METYLIYIDESYDDGKWTYSAIFVPISQWNIVFSNVTAWRESLKNNYGIPIESELHATKFIGNRGTSNPMTKEARALIFKESLSFVETLSQFQVSIINGIATKGRQGLLFEYLLNRIQTALSVNNAYGILICDEGNEKELIRTVRRMKKQNNVPSHFGGTTMAVLQNIIEDPLFKTSDSSHFIQLADFVAFALLRNKKPVHTTNPNVQTAFDELDTVLNKRASKNDAKGIIRA